MSVNKINNDGTLSPMAGTPALKLNGIQDNINKNGTKNLLPNRGTSYTAGNLTITKNTDGSVTLNGTNNTGSTVWWKFAEDIVWGNEDESWEINGFPNEHTYNGYIFSLDGDSSVTIGTGLFYFGFTVANSTTWIGINPGASFSNLTIYPMVRLASDTDSTYQPYAMTNQMVTSLLTTNEAFIVPVVLGNTYSMAEVPYRCNHVKLETLGVLGNVAVYISSVTFNVYNKTFIYTETQSLVNLLAADSHYTGLTKEALVAEGGLHAYLSIVD